MKSFIKALFLGTLLAFLLLSVGCMKQINKNLTIIEAKKSYIEGDTTRAFHLSEILAHEGDPKAQYALGYMYYYGLGAPVNKSLGISWMKQAEEQGDPSAQLALKAIEEAQNKHS